MAAGGLVVSASQPPARSGVHASPSSLPCASRSPAGRSLPLSPDPHQRDQRDLSCRTFLNRDPHCHSPVYRPDSHFGSPVRYPPSTPLPITTGSAREPTGLGSNACSAGCFVLCPQTASSSFLRLSFLPWKMGMLSQSLGRLLGMIRGKPGTQDALRTCSCYCDCGYESDGRGFSAWACQSCLNELTDPLPAQSLSFFISLGG